MTHSASCSLFSIGRLQGIISYLGVKLVTASIAQTRKSMRGLRHDRSGSEVKNVELSDHTISADLTMELKLGLAGFP